MKTSILLLLAVTILPAQSVTTALPGEQYQNLSNPRRDPWQKPDQVIAALNFSPSERVAVIEEGFPYFAPRIAPLVQKVYAVSSDPRSFQGPGRLPPAISPVISTNSDPKLLGLNVDTILMVDMLSGIPQRPQFYLAMIAGLKPGGRLVVIDRQLSSIFPDSERVTDATAKGELSSSGFALGKQFTLLDYQYFLVFNR